MGHIGMRMRSCVECGWKTGPQYVKGAWFSYSSMPIAMNHLKINGYKMIQYTSILRPGYKGSCGLVAGTVGTNC